MIDSPELTHESDDARTEKVRHRAYELWMRDGAPHGRDQDYWFQAEREISEEEGPAETSEPAIPNIEPD